MGENEIMNSTLPLILLGIIGMLLLAIAVVVFFVVYQKRLFRQQEELRSMEVKYQKELLAAAIATQEQERERIANDLHDGVGSGLSAVRLYIAQLASTAPVNELATDAKGMLDDIIKQVRGVSHELLPSGLLRFGLVAAIEDHCQRLAKINNLDVTFAYDQTYELPKAQILALYRIVQELTNNTLKHAQATTIDIKLTTTDDTMTFIYADNGLGFDASQLKDSQGGLGLKSIESRASLHGGTMTVDSAVGKGASFEFHWPVAVAA